MSEDVFARIQKAAQTLNKKADQATEYLRGVEDRLAQLGVGVDVFVDTYVETRQYTKTDLPQGVNRVPYLVEETIQLGYGKIRGRWGLILRTETWNCPNDPQNSEVEESEDEFLLSADRASRVKAVPLVPALLEAIEKELAQVTGQIEKALPSPRASK